MLSGRTTGTGESLTTADPLRLEWPLDVLVHLVQILLVSFWFLYLKNEQMALCTCYSELGEVEVPSRKDLNTVYSLVPQLFPKRSSTSVPYTDHHSYQVSLVPSISLPWHMPASLKHCCSFFWSVMVRNGLIKVGGSPWVEILSISEFRGISLWHFTKVGHLYGRCAKVARS